MKQKERAFTTSITAMEATIQAIHKSPEAAAMRKQFAEDFKERLEVCIELKGGQVDLKKRKKTKDPNNNNNREGLPRLGRPPNVARKLDVDE